MHRPTRSIGALARESGLSVSALRFYDAAGVLRPAQVDAETGYRWYGADQVGPARLIAGLRRVNMPLADICAVLAARDDPERAARLLDRHLERLEDGLADARRHLATVRDLLTAQETPMSHVTVRRCDLVAAAAAVRFAVSNDPDLLALTGVLFDFDGDTLRLVASDRYRLAVATVTTRNPAGPAIELIAPTALLDHLDPSDDELHIQLEGGAITLDGQRTTAIEAVFPDYRRLLHDGPARSITVTTAELVDAITTGPTRTLIQAPGDQPHEVSVVRVGRDDTVDVLAGDHPDAVGFNREFLLEAVDALGADQLVLALDGPIHPLAIRDPGRPDDISLLMPTRLT